MKVDVVQSPKLEVDDDEAASGTLRDVSQEAPGHVSWHPCRVKFLLPLISTTSSSLSHATHID